MLTFGMKGDGMNGTKTPVAAPAATPDHFAATFGGGVGPNVS